MKHWSMKRKIAGFYTLLLAAGLLISFSGAVVLTYFYTGADIRKELEDEVKDLRDLILDHPEVLTEGKASVFYDDGIINSVYNEEGELIAGIAPQDFPEEIFDEENTVRSAGADGKNWYYIDMSLELEGENYRIRGVCPYPLRSEMVKNLVRELILLIVLWLILIQGCGYRMAGRLLRPVSEMTRMAAKISRSPNLSGRLPEMKSEDEFSELTDTFNSMLDHMDHLLQSEKRFSSDAAHELRTPISVIISHCEYCLEEFELSEELREELEIIYGKAKALSDLVTKLLAITRAESDRISLVTEQVDLGLLVEIVLEELQEQAVRKQISISFENKAEPAVMRGDQSLLTQMFMNLAENSIKYGKEGGHTHVTLERENNQFRLTVSDDGIGIPEESLDKIWERFYRAESVRQTEGIGLGLPMVRWIVRQHGGTVRAAGNPEGGAVFIVWLPESSAAEM